VGIEDTVVEAFKGSLHGALLRPGEAGDEDARTIHHGRIDHRTALIARCAGVADGLTGVRFARDHDVLVSVRSGGHSMQGFALCEGGLMLGLSRIHSLHVDPHHRIVRAEAGVTWTDVRPRDPSLRVGHRRRRGRVYRGDGRLRDGARIDLTHHDQTVRLLSVHRKSGCFDNATPSSARATLVRQVPVLEGWIDAAAQGLTLCIGLGDFNLRLTQPNDWVWAELDDGEPVNADLTALTQDMPVSGQDHTLTEVIDHIVVPGVPCNWC
jgi:FAD binding domain